jgi:hypothetical protein
MDETQNGQVPVQGGDDVADQPQAAPENQGAPMGGSDMGQGGTTAGDEGAMGGDAAEDESEKDESGAA